ncbi:MAG: NAD-dependent epimerase/dehydratase family protein [Actinobacteria bacterium]|nr:NAD-dependent epimerase/dehydratase family protein [Actinomycetota bacterium]
MDARIILITGAAGFVGRHLQEAIAQRMPQARLCLMDHPSSGICKAGAAIEYDEQTARVSADLTCAEDSRLALEALATNVGIPDLVFHLAAHAEVGRSFRAPSATYNANVVGTARLLEAISDLTNTCRVLIPSSAQVYAAAGPCVAADSCADSPSDDPDAANDAVATGGVSEVDGADAADIDGTDAGDAGIVAIDDAGPPINTTCLLDESAPIGPSSHYGVSKFAQEEIGRLFFETTGLPVMITRAFNHTGPGQGTGFVVPDFARQLAVLEREMATESWVAAAKRALAEPTKTPLPAGTIRVGNLDSRRDYLDVRDVVSAYLVVMERGTPGQPYNIASGTAWSTRKILEVLLSHCTVPISVYQDPKLLRPKDASVLIGDASRLRALGWQAQHNLSDTLRETLDYWRRMTGSRLSPHRPHGETTQ